MEDNNPGQMVTDNILQKKISSMRFTERHKSNATLINRLERKGITTLGELVKETREELYKYKNLGNASLDAIEKALSKEGLALATESEQSKDKNLLSSHKLSSRLRRALHWEKITTLQELSAKTADELSSMKDVAEGGVQEARELLGRYGLALSGEKPVAYEPDRPLSKEQAAQLQKALRAVQEVRELQELAVSDKDPLSPRQKRQIKKAMRLIIQGQKILNNLYKEEGQE